MLLAPELCRAVESAGAASRMTVAALRELAERAFAQAQRGALDAEGLVASLEHDALRTALARERSEAQKGRADTLEAELKALQIKLHRHEKLAAQEALRKRAREPKVPREPA